MGGLVQVWFYTIQNDNYSVYNHEGLVAQAGADNEFGFASNEVNDNDGFAIRRAQLRFTMDIHENVRAYIMLDPASEADSFPGLPTNQSSLGTGVVNINNGFQTVIQGDDGELFIEVQDAGAVRNDAVRTGDGTANRTVHEAWIQYHGIVPHHDFRVGQMLPHLGEEGIRDDAELDFVERSMIGQTAHNYDLGLEAHGTWFDDRLQYWISVFDGAGTAFQSRANRADDNDDFDVVAAVMGRPVWKDETWGSLELGYSIRWGQGGEASSHTPGQTPLDGLNRRRTNHVMHNAYVHYLAGGPVRGLWLRGEYQQYRDRFAPNEVITGLANVTSDPAEFTIRGWYGALGYRMSDSIFGESLRGSNKVLLKSLLEPMEFAFRYEVMQNLFYHDLQHPTRRLDAYQTQVVTAGINYYIRGHNAKLQFNYNWVDEESHIRNTGGDFPRAVRDVKNDNFVVNFQVAW